MKFWQRYLFFRLAKLFLFFSCCLFAIYVVVDLSSHGVRFLSHKTLSLFEIALYYSHRFSIYFPLFSSLAFLLASLRVLFDLAAHQELVALQMAGLSKKQLLFPFFCFASLLLLSSYANSQWFAPEAQDGLDAFRSKKAKREHVFNLSLRSGSVLVYQSFDPKTKELFDVFWVQSPDKIWHMKYLYLSPQPAKGHYVDRLERNSAGQFEKTQSFAEMTLPKLRWDEGADLERFIPFENRPISQLLKQAHSSPADKEAILAHLHYKLAMPLLPFLILFSIAPFAMRFSRSQPAFLLATCSLFAFIASITVMDGMLILGENHVLPPSFAIWGPLTLALIAALRSFRQIDR